MAEESELSISFRLTWLYMDAETRQRFETASNLGWAYKTLVQQTLGAFFKVHRDFYAAAAAADYTARGMERPAYYDALQSGSELPDYISSKPDWSRLPISGTDGEFYKVPLSTVPPPPTAEGNRQRYNTVTTSRANYAGLMVARIVHGLPLTTLVSTIVKEHFLKYWDRNYLTQVQLYQEKRFTLKHED